MSSTIERIDPEPDWKRTASEIGTSGDIRTIYVVGHPGSGKTSLSLYLYDNLLETASDNASAAYLDCDCGQSTAALPLTVSLRSDRRPFKIPKVLTGPGIASKFVGSTSPVKHILQTADGIVRLHRRALAAGNEKIIVDSSGFVTGPLAEEFQFNIIDMVAPDMIIALPPENGRNEGLGAILTNFEGSSARVRSLRVSSRARLRSRTERRRYREEKLTEYFADSRDVDVDLDNVGLHGFIPSAGEDGESGRGRVLGLLNKEGFLLTMGIVRSADWRKRRLTILVPQESIQTLDGTRSLQFGLAKLDPDGTEKEE